MKPSTLLLPFAALALACGGAAGAADQPAKVLVFTRSQGFEHSMVKAKPDKPAQIQTELTELGAKHNFTITVTKDGGEFTPEKLKAYDLYFFYTTGDLTKAGGDGNPPMSPEGKQALFDAIKGGKGFVGTHSASDTFHSASGAHSYKVDPEVDPYITMLGAEFIMHGAQQKTKVITVDPTFPVLADQKDGYEMLEEWYSLKQFQKDLHVLQVLDMTGMKGNLYQRGNYPVTWIHPYGKGRVFYTAMGHREDVWTNPIFREILAAGIDYALGRTKVDDSPNLEKVAPKYADMPPPK
jgi:hypothetical protein